MGEFTHALRNPIRERDDRIASLEAEVAALKAKLAEPDEKVRTLHAGASDYMKCASRDCWLCHGTPENAGPR